MKRTAFLSILIAGFALAACNTSTEDKNTREVEKKEDKAEEAAARMESAAEDRDTTAVQLEH